MCDPAGLTIRSQHRGQRSGLNSVTCCSLEQQLCDFTWSVLFVYSCLFFVVVAVVFSSSVRDSSWPDSPFWGCPVLKEDLSHYKQKWRGQSKCCSCLRTWCQCQTACCLDTEHRGLALGFGNVQKVSWIITLLQPQKDISPSLLRVRFCFTNDHFFSCLFHSKWWACKKNCSRFPHPSLSSFFHAWHPVGVDKHLPFEGNNPLKEEPGPIDVLPLEQISKAAHEREEHHFFLWWKNM